MKFSAFDGSKQWVTLAGTTDQIAVSGVSGGTVTLSLPQSIATDSSVEFGSVSTILLQSSSSIEITPASSLGISLNCAAGAFVDIHSTDGAGAGLRFRLQDADDPGGHVTWDNDGTVKWSAGMLGDSTNNWRLWNNAASANALAVNSATNVTTIASLTLGAALPVASGGTGQTSYTNGQLLVGDTTGNTLVKATLTGTSNQVNVTNGGGSITLSLPQSIATSSSPTFASLTLSADLSVQGNTTIGDASADTLTLNAAAWTVPNTITWTKTQETGVGEVLAIWKISDSSTQFRLLNNTTNIAQFAPAFDSAVEAGVASTAFAFNATKGDSGTTNANMLILARYNSGSGNTDAPAECPMLEIRNRATAGFYFTGGYNLKFLGGSTSPTIGSVAAGDIVTMCGFDRVNTRHAAAGNRMLGLQSERGSPIYLGDDAVDFGATTALISVNAVDVITLTSTSITLADGVNIATGTTTGLKLLTGTTQKLGLWNATPVAQYSTTGTTTGFTAATGTAVLSGSTFTGNTGSAAYTIGDVVRALKLCGIMAA